MRTLASELFYQVLSRNAAQQHRAARLNMMAGEEIFPVLKDEELVAFVLKALGGARSIAEVNDLSGLLLPPLDEERAEKVEETHRLLMPAPGDAYADGRWYSGRRDEVELLGRKFEIYRWSREPSVRIDVDPKMDLSQLPDAGVFFEQKRIVVTLAAWWLDVYDLEGLDVADLKRRIRVPFIKGSLKRFFESRNYDFVSPLRSYVRRGLQAGMILPEVVEHVVCRDPVTGRPIFAYGALRVRGSDGTLEEVWFDNREEAENQRAGIEEWFKSKMERSAKKLGHQEEAQKIEKQLASLVRELAGFDSPTVNLVAEHLGAYKQLNLNKASLVINWTKRAASLLTAGNSLIIRSEELLRKVVDQFLERVLLIEEESAQEAALACVGELDSLYASGERGGILESLITARTALLEGEH